MEQSDAMALSGAGTGTQTSAFLDHYEAVSGHGDPRVEGLRFPVIQEPSTARLPTVYEARPAEGASVCDGARTLRLVEQAVESMQNLRNRADLISAQALDLLHLTHRERAQMEAGLEQAQEAAKAWERQARASQDALAEAAVLIKEADIARRELELSVHQTRARAEAAEARVSSLEHYLKEIRVFLEARMTAFR